MGNVVARVIYFYYENLS